MAIISQYINNISNHDVMYHKLNLDKAEKMILDFSIK